jgi:hypothetical protein
VSVCVLGLHLEDFLILDNGFIRATPAQKSPREIVSRFFQGGSAREAGRLPGDRTIEIVYGYQRSRKIA